jgi:hypothetical protein
MCRKFKKKIQKDNKHRNQSSIHQPAIIKLFLERMMTKCQSVNRLDLIYLVCKHLIVAIEPVSKQQAWNRSQLKKLDVQQSKFIVESRWQSVEVS